MIGQIHFSPSDRGTSFITSDGRIFFLCNGQAIPRSEYSAMSAIWPSGTYASDDENIHLPYLNDVFLRGVDMGRGVVANPLTRTALSGYAPSGVEPGSFQAANMQSHLHPSGTYATQTFASQGGPAGGLNSSTLANITSATTLMSPQTSGTHIPGGSGTTDYDLPHMKVYPYICTL